MTHMYTHACVYTLYIPHKQNPKPKSSQ